MPTALIVDDEPQNLYLLRCVLAADGFEFVEASNGREALERAAERTIDLVISDILMPVMDGFSLCREWKTHPAWKTIPFIFYTATYVDKRDEELALSLGADVFIVKPADPAVLRERVAEVLAKYRNGQLARGAEPVAETPFLQQYNAVLIRKLEEKLLQLEGANQALRIKDLALASSASGVLLTTPAGQVSYANPSMARLCSRPEAEMTGRPVEELFVQPEQLAPWRSGAATTGPLELQLALALPETPPVWVQVTGHAVTDGQGRRVGDMLSCLDITEEKRLRQELIRIQRLEMLSLFAAGVAHDFNNLLVPIYAGLGLGDVECTPESDRDADQAMALAAFDRAKDLTRRLLIFSRGSTSQRRAVELGHLLDESISLALSGSSVRCERHYAMQPKVLGDPGQLAQVFSNLLVNARQAMKDRGTVTVSTGIAEAQRAGALAPGRYAFVRIQDDGPGIAPEVLPRIFDPYFTTKPEGSGLGLATSQAIVQEHGGRVSVSTEVGAGATFEILLPLSPETPGQEHHPARAPARAVNGRILVMDDQVAIQALVQRRLERAGHSVVVTSNGEQALLEFERARGQGRAFDLVILDITVRGGMGGIETLAKLRQTDPRLLAIATTGYSGDGETGDLREKGFVQVLCKPFLAHELLSTISAVLPSG